MDTIDRAQWEHEMQNTENIVEYDPEDTRMHLEVMDLADQAMQQLRNIGILPTDIETVQDLDIPLPPRPDDLDGPPGYL